MRDKGNVARKGQSIGRQRRVVTLVHPPSPRRQVLTPSQPGSQAHSLTHSISISIISWGQVRGKVLTDSPKLCHETGSSSLFQLAHCFLVYRGGFSVVYQPSPSQRQRDPFLPSLYPLSSPYIHCLLLYQRHTTPMCHLGTTHTHTQCKQTSHLTHPSRYKSRFRVCKQM